MLSIETPLECILISVGGMFLFGIGAYLGIKLLEIGVFLLRQLEKLQRR